MGKTRKYDLKIKMSYTLLINIKKLLQIRDRGTSYVSGKEMSEIPSIESAYLVINNGIIEEYGTHDQLMNKNGYYKQTYNQQLIEKEISE